MASWMRIERAHGSMQSERVGVLAHNVLALMPGICNVSVLTETTHAAAMAYVCVGPLPLEHIDRRLHDVDLLRTVDIGPMEQAEATAIFDRDSAVRNFRPR